MNVLSVTNQDIDQLHQICWKQFGNHQDEEFKVPLRSEEELQGLINDASSSLSDYDGEDLPIQNDKDNVKLSIENISNRLSPYLVAVDGGIAHLGSFAGGGIAFAIRGSAVCYSLKGITILKYNTGPIIIDNSNKVDAFYHMGKCLGNESFYLQKKDDGTYMPKASAFENANQIQDRCRSFVERMIQKEVLGLLSSNRNGIILIDGALSAGTFDTPSMYLQSFLERAVDSNIDIIGISKKSSLSLNGISISDLFEKHPSFVGFRRIKQEIEDERKALEIEGKTLRISNITLGNEIYVARFGLGPPAISFRVDVKNSWRSSGDEVMNFIFENCQIMSCYPKPLIEAHQSCSFFYPDIQSMTAEIVARTGAILKEEQSMDWMFQPFGAFGK